MPRIPRGEGPEDRKKREAREAEKRLRMRQVTTLKIGMMELKTIIPVVASDMDAQTALSLASSLRTVAIKANSVAAWLEARWPARKAKDNVPGNSTEPV